MTSEFLALAYIAVLAPDQGETIAQVFYRDEPHQEAPELGPRTNTGYIDAGRRFQKPFCTTCNRRTNRSVSGCAENGRLAEDPEGSLWIKALSGLYHLRGASCEQITEVDGYLEGLPQQFWSPAREPFGRRRHRGALFFRRKNESKFELSQSQLALGQQ